MKSISVLIILCGIQLNGFSQQCISYATSVFFANGINNTLAQSLESLEGLNVEYKKHNKNLHSNMIFSSLYNRTEGLKDFVEVFDQRLSEHEEKLNERFELFFETVKGGDELWSKIKNTIAKYNDIHDSLQQSSKAATVKYLTSLIARPAKELDYVRQKIEIERHIEYGHKILVVAHSQGNLFANRVFEHASSILYPGSVALVHVAPASLNLNGEYVLADLDFVIGALRAFGDVPKPSHAIPSYSNRPAGTNNQKDILGHGFQEIYINPKLDISKAVLRNIDNAASSLTAPFIRIPYPTTTLTGPACCEPNKPCFPSF